MPTNERLLARLGSNASHSMPCHSKIFAILDKRRNHSSIAVQGVVKASTGSAICVRSVLGSHISIHHEPGAGAKNGPPRVRKSSYTGKMLIKYVGMQSSCGRLLLSRLERLASISQSSFATPLVQSITTTLQRLNHLRLNSMKHVH